MVDIAPATDGARREITQLIVHLRMSLDADVKTQRADIWYDSPQLSDGEEVPKDVRLHVLRGMQIILANAIKEDEKP